MIDRPFWTRRIESAWREAPIVWLSGVRRSGKTTLAQSLGSRAPFFVNCDIPAIEGMVPAATAMPEGCRFAARCPFADAHCRAEAPPLREIAPGHASRCWKAPLEALAATLPALDLAPAS